MYLIGMKFFVSLLGGVRNVGNFQWTIFDCALQKRFYEWNWGFRYQFTHKYPEVIINIRNATAMAQWHKEHNKPKITELTTLYKYMYMCTYRTVCCGGRRAGRWRVTSDCRARRCDSRRSSCWRARSCAGPNLRSKNQDNILMSHDC